MASLSRTITSGVESERIQHRQAGASLRVRRAPLRVRAAAETAVVDGDARRTFTAVPLPPLPIKKTQLVTIKEGECLLGTWP